jgi:hypothetical protein
MFLSETKADSILVNTANILLMVAATKMLMKGAATSNFLMNESLADVNE